MDTLAIQDRALEVLLLEDVESDAELVQRELRKAGIAFQAQTVWTSEDFIAALDSRPPDVILSDFSMPRFNALDALSILKKRGQKVPFILYTGTQSEEVAVACMREGADDYVLKSSLTRLPTAIQNALDKQAATEREQEAFERLRWAEESFRALTEGSPDAMAVIRDGQIAYVNPSLVSYLRYKGGRELLARPFAEIVHVTERDAVVAALDAHTGDGTRIEVPFIRRDGTTAMGEAVAINIVFEGNPAQALVVRDVTERKHMQARMLLADRLASVGGLAAGVAHEINNPLGYMITNLQYIDEEIEDVLNGLRGGADAESAVLRERIGRLRVVLEDLSEPIKIARRGADRVRNIVGDLMTFSRSDNAGRAPLDVREVLEFTIKMASNEIKRRAQLVRDFQDVPKVNANESRLGQVFLNLLINATQAIPEGLASENRIRVTTCAEDGNVVVRVEDTGTGIPPEVQSRIFDPFYTTKPVGVGTGLGLSICHTLITSFGGTIAFESELGKGSAFSVILPAHSG